jgi:hypothetical protein
VSCRLEGFELTVKDLLVQTITTFSVGGEGTHLRMNFICRDGDPASISLPTACLNRLIVELPHMMREVLRAGYRDESLRIVYPVASIRIEHSSGSKAAVVTLATPDGFEVSFGLTRRQMAAFDAAEAIGCDNGDT